MLVPKNLLGTFMPMQRGNMKLWKKGSRLYAATESGNYMLMQEITGEDTRKHAKSSRRWEQ